MENTTFSYSYSAPRAREIEKIRKKYIPEQQSALERLKQLDRAVNRAGVIESLCLGIVGTLVFGVGICFMLEVFVAAWWMSAVFCMPGALIAALAYPIYKHLSKKERAARLPEIMELLQKIDSSEGNQN